MAAKHVESWQLYRWLLGYAKPYSKFIALLGSLTVVEVGIGLLVPWPLKILIDNVLVQGPLPPWLHSLASLFTTHHRLALLIGVCVTSLVVELISEIVSMIHTQVQVGTAQRMMNDLRRDLFSHLQKLSLRFHQTAGAGDAIYRIENDSFCVDSIIMSGFFPLANSLLMLTLMFAILLRLDATLAMLSLTVIPFLFLTIHHYSNRLVEREEEVKGLEAGIFNLVHEVFSSIRLVKAFSRENYEQHRFAREGLVTLRARMKITLQESLFGVIVNAITYTGTAAVLAVGGWHVMNHELSIGELLVIIAYLGSVYGPLSSMSHTLGQLQGSKASARRAYETLRLDLEITDRPGALVAPRLEGNIRFDNVSFAYNDARPVLNNISFEVHPGQMVAVVGLTGAGKTTLVSLIPRFFDPTSGEIEIDGINIKRMQITSLRDSVSIVLQEPILFSGSIEDNIKYGKLNATREQVIAAAKAAQAHDFIMNMEDQYDARVGEAGGTLSGGERQRISIARALLKDAPILILDEPTASLDSRSEGRVFEALKNLMAGRTTIVIAHRLSTIRNADQIIVLDGGEIVGAGRHEELLESVDLYRELCARLSMGVIPAALEPALVGAET